MTVFKPLLLLSVCLTISCSATGQEKPAPQYKPYPEKSTLKSIDKVPEEQAPNFSKPSKKEPTLALKAHPPTSGKEPMLQLNEQGIPLKETLHQVAKTDYYDCDGVVAPWFRALLIAEMNYFSEMVEMPLLKGDACVLTIGTSRSLSPGRIGIQLYASKLAMQDCVTRDRCPAFRSVNLIPRKGNGVYRSYFLSDLDRKMIAQQCVTSKGKWHADTTCYAVE